MHALRLQRAPFAAFFCMAATAVAACEGEQVTDPEEPFPYDLVVERREGTSGPPDLQRIDIQTGESGSILGTSVGGMHPSGSPAGSRVAFVRTDAEFDDEIFVVTREGGGPFGDLTNLTSTSAPDAMPAWSPDGQRLAFVSDRDGGFQDIFVMDAVGTNVRRVTPADPPQVVTTEWWPAWSPDGDLIAYSSTLEGTADIWTITVDATTVVRTLLTSGPDIDLHPTWSPDGERIAFQRIDANTGEVDIMVLTLGSGQLQRISMRGQQLWPAWSPTAGPEGDLIAFSSNHEDVDFEIYTMRPDGSSVVRRTDNGLNDLRVTWLLRP